MIYSQTQRFGCREDIVICHAKTLFGNSCNCTCFSIVYIAVFIRHYFQLGSLAPFKSRIAWIFFVLIFHLSNYLCIYPDSEYLQYVELISLRLLLFCYTPNSRRRAFKTALVYILVVLASADFEYTLCSLGRAIRVNCFGTIGCAGTREPRQVAPQNIDS